MKTEMEIQKEHVNTLLQLITKNPDLKIVPMVDYEIVGGDDLRYWLGSFNKSEIDHIWGNDERIYFKSSDFEELVQDEVDNIYDAAELLHESHPMYETIEKRAEARVLNYEWEKVIVVWITTP